MFSPNIYLYLLAVLYILILEIVSIRLLFKKKITSPRHISLFLFFLALLIRYLAVSFFPFGSGYDISSFCWAAGRVFEGKDIFFSKEAIYHYNYFPTLAIVWSYLIKLGSQFNMSCLPLIKLPIIFFDSFLAVLLFKISKNFRYSLIYALSNIGVIIGAYHGQFDSIPLFFSILALYLLTQKKQILSILSIGLGTITKPWVVMFAPLIWFRSKEKKLLAVVFIIPLLLIVIFYKLIIQERINMLIMAVAISTYSSGVGWWGPAILLEHLAKILHHGKILTIPAQLSKLLSISLIIFLAKKFNRENVFYLGKLVILIIYIFSLGLSTHYFLWILPFALLTKDSFLKSYLLFVGAFLIFFNVFGGLSYNFLPPETPVIFYKPISFLLWLFFLSWGIKEVRLILRNYILT